MTEELLPGSAQKIQKVQTVFGVKRGTLCNYAGQPVVTEWVSFKVAGVDGMQLRCARWEM